MVMKARVFPLFILCGVLAGAALSAQAVEATAAVQANATVNPLPAGAAPAYSGGIDDVVKLAHSGVDETVVLSYIKNSPGPFNPSADEIIRLRDAGISAPEISAMLERGAELRQPVVAAAPAPAPGYNGYNYGQPATAAPPSDQGAMAAPDTYADSSYYAQPGSSVAYIGGDYGYPVYYNSYPYYYGGLYWPYFYPFACWFGGCYYPHGCYFRNWNAFCSGFRGFPHGGFNGFHGGFNGFHGGFAGAGFHNGFAGGGFHSGFAGGVHSGFVGGFHGNAVGGGYHSGFVGGGVHSGFGGGGFHGFSGGGFHGGSVGRMGGGGGGFHGGGGGGHR